MALNGLYMLLSLKFFHFMFEKTRKKGLAKLE
jgi:hypothetical protein